eukprot:TRINITY_DN5651_c0_g1_i2.p1 TRINITY_DN5651_c0_g1~~TRINITY_DN5651_c0_g1_i2.p1  ORF type:complete len:253 (-),score=56.83 TRINITY_DN5651_c0_g1_i2:149-907(-)
MSGKNLSQSSNNLGSRSGSPPPVTGSDAKQGPSTTQKVGRFKVTKQGQQLTRSNTVSGAVERGLTPGHAPTGAAAAAASAGTSTARATTATSTGTSTGPADKSNAMPPPVSVQTALCYQLKVLLNQSSVQTKLINKIANQMSFQMTPDITHKYLTEDPILLAMRLQNEIAALVQQNRDLKRENNALMRQSKSSSTSTTNLFLGEGQQQSDTNVLTGLSTSTSLDHAAAAGDAPKRQKSLTPRKVEGGGDNNR